MERREDLAARDLTLLHALAGMDRQDHPTILGTMFDHDPKRLARQFLVRSITSMRPA